MGISRAKDAVSNQYLLDPTEYAYLLTNYHNTDDLQFMTGSAGASYKWDKTLLSVSAIYGSGLRSGFANMDHVPAYPVSTSATSRASAFRAAIWRAARVLRGALAKAVSVSRGVERRERLLC